MHLRFIYRIIYRSIASEGYQQDSEEETMQQQGEGTFHLPVAQMTDNSDSYPPNPLTQQAAAEKGLPPQRTITWEQLQVLYG